MMTTDHATVYTVHGTAHQWMTAYRYLDPQIEHRVFAAVRGAAHLGEQVSISFFSHEHQLATHAQQELLGQRTYSFRDTADPRVSYTTTRHPDGGITCDCPAFQDSGHCAHAERLHTAPLLRVA